jgi:pullulanase-type alpha-1,6-glucosidase
MGNRFVAAGIAGALVLSTALTGAARASDTPPPTTVTIAGSLQSELGCAGDWDPACSASQLTYDANGDAWLATFTLPAGAWEYKAALDGTWDENYGANATRDGSNIALTLPDATDVTFLYSHGTHWITDDVTSRVVTAPGSFQSELGCSGDWDPACLRSWLQDPDGDGTYTFTTDTLPAGTYEGKAAIDRAWDENYGAGGAANGANIAFTVVDGDTVTFSFVSATNTLTITAQGTGGNSDIEPGDELLVTAPSRPVTDESVYFVMTDRFANGDPSNDTAGLTGDKFVHGFDPTDKAFHHGGDLAGLTAQLDYIEGLGVTSIWITPPFRNDYVQMSGGPGSASSSYHGYWQVDYTQIDPHYGTNAEMQAFVDAAHARGMKVIFDVVLNHTGDVITYEENQFTYRNKTDFPYRDASGDEFDDRDFEGTGTFPDLDPATSFPYTPTFATPDDATAKSPAWLNDVRYYHNRGNSTFAGENSQYGDFFGLDDLFSEHPVVVDGMIDIHTSMIDTFGVDGFRVDTVKHVSDGFWEAWVPAVMDHAAAAGKPDFVMFGEVFGETVEFRSRYSTELDFPGTLDFGFNGAARRFAAASAPTAELAAFFETDDWYTDADSNAHDLAKFIGNHDEGRFALEVRNDNPGAPDAELVARLALGQALNFLTRGRPVVYYGDEQGFVGDGGDQDARQDMFPSQVATYNDDDLIGTDATTADDNFDPTHPLYVAIADVATLRGAHPALQTGAQITRSASGGPGVFAFSRIDATEQVEYVVALNNAESPAGATFTTDTSNATWTAVWPAAGAPLTSGADGSLTVEVPALGFVVYRADTTIDQPGTTSIAMAGPAAGSEVVGRVPVGASTSGGYGEVTFAASIDGAPYEVLGVDDNAPYRVYHDVSGLAAGTTVTYKAIVKNANGHLASDRVEVVVGDQTPPPPPTGGPEYAIVHYQRADGNYGDHTTGDFTDFWGLHLWGGAIDPSEVTEWTAPKPFLGEDEYGRFAWIRLADVSQPLNFIVHRGDTKDGTDADRSFDAAAHPEVWLKQDDPNVYTSQAAAQGYVTIHYQRPDADYTDWGLHLWGDAIDPAEATEWATPKPPTGIDDYGAYWKVAVQDVTLPVNFIVHRGDEKDPGPDQSMVPADDASIWLQSGDTTLYPTRGAAEGYAEIHYHRADGDYGDPTSDDFTDFWGLHVWAGAASPNPAWQQPVKPTGFDVFGPYWQIPLQDGAPELAYIIHRGDTKDPGPDQFLTFADYGHQVWQLENADPESPYILPVPAGGGGSGGDLTAERAHWVDADTIVWPGADDATLDYSLCHTPDGGLTLDAAGIGGGECVELTPAGTYPADVDGRRHLAGAPAFDLPADIGADVPAILTGQVAVAASAAGVRIDATGLQIPGVLDDLFATDAELGVVWAGDVPSIRLWAPTAKSVTLHLYDDSTTSNFDTVDMTNDAGVWSATGDASWRGAYYLFEVEVYAPSTGQVVTNVVTDPYSVSLSTNSTRSQIVDLDDPALRPDAWDDTAKPELPRPEDVSIYELHVRDFSITDETVPAADRGTFAAFTHEGSDGMHHLAALADAGLSFVHLLPVFDIATVNEDASQRQEPDPAVLAAYPPDSPEQQAAVMTTAAQDGFNWGYDPLHYTTPEGSYSTDPDGPQRIVEFREMVQSLNRTGLRVVMDVVYNHTHASGQDPLSVLDRIVPGYYHRLNDVGVVETSTCCANTATEHEMMGKLMTDSVVTWAKQYRVDGFRFDLMGHHSKQNLLDLRAALDALTLADDGVDGSKIYLYGEGWNFGEVANDARFVQATQLNMGGTGIGTFSDRLRDAVRGGGPFDGGLDLVRNQGFVNGLWYDPNADALPEGDALQRLLLAGDQIRVGLAGNLADYEFVDRTGTVVAGSQVDYNGSPAGYTHDPQENIVYVEAHDNQTLFDIGQYHHPLDTPMDERVRAQNVANAIVAFAQGVPFLHAGQDILRSKSMDRNSYDSGDWFNRIDWTLQSNNWGVGLPPAPDNEANWPLIGPRLATLPAPAPADIERTAAVTREWFEIRMGSPLFRLETAEEIQQRLTFGNTGPSQTPGLIVMSLSDDVDGLTDLDAELEGVHVLFNATDDAVSYTDASLAGAAIELHPVLAGSIDPVVATSAFDTATGTFTVPARTAAVFVDPGPDVTPPEAHADLHRVLRLGHRAGLYVVRATCTDDRGDVSVTADINGVPVDDGDVAFLFEHRRRRAIVGDHVVIMWAPRFVLTVTCTDAAGNTSTATDRVG